ncbi:MAG: four helix bundle protein [Mucilaginibacter polytrichastri]|nr:four helix bundle protein [Mucilaginibacter polytrichastri]
MRDFKKLEIWQRSHRSTLSVYTLTNYFPPEERYGLSSQMRRSASSVPTNIAEGCGRNSIPDLKRYLIIACGSLSELHYQIILSNDLRYFHASIFKELAEEVIQIRKMIHAYSEKLDPPVRALKADS